MNATRKTLVKLAILNALKPLEAAQKIRQLAWKKTIFIEAQPAPAVHLVAGPESVIEEDTAGYKIEFPLDCKCMVTGNDTELLSDQLAAEVQAALERDTQLGDKVTMLKYDGDTPFVNELNKPDGGIFLHYTVQYRRARGVPAASYPSH